MRLIDADKISFRYAEDDNCLGCDMSPDEQDIYNEAVDDCMYRLGLHSVDYDIDKVINQLKEHFDTTKNKDMRLAYHHAINIVKGGGEK